MDFNTSFVQNPELTTWFEFNQKRILGYRIQLNKHVGLMTEDYDTEFMDAVSRAIAELAPDGNVEKCEGNAMQAMMGSKVKCEGKDISKDIAKKIDADPELQTAIQEINAIAWPVPQVEPKTQPVIPVTGSENYIDLYAFSSRFLQNRLDEHSQWLEEQTDTIIEDLESGDSKAIKKAEEFRKEYQQRIADDGKKFLTDFQAFAEKRSKKYPELGNLAFCANVKELGGCEGKDVSNETITALETNRKFLKFLKKSGF